MSTFHKHRLMFIQRGDGVDEDESNSTTLMSVLAPYLNIDVFI